MFRPLALTLILAAALAALAAAVRAEEPAPSPSPSPTSPDRVFDLGEMVVTGSWQSLQLGDSPANLSVVPRQTVRQIRPFDPGEVLPGVPGVFVRRSGTTGAIATVSIRGSGSTDVQVMLDGRPLNQPGVGTADLSLLPGDFIDRVEVVRGPYSALYGPYAVSGAVNILTRKPRPEDTPGRIDLVAGGQGTAQESARFAWAEKDGPSLLLVPTLRRVHGFRPNGDSRLDSLFLRLDDPLAPQESLTFSSGYQNTRVGTPGPVPAADPARRDASQLALGDNEVSTTRDYQTNHNWFAHLRYEGQNLDLRACYTSWQPQFHFEFVDFFSSLHQDDSFSRESQYGLEARYRIRHLEDSAFTVGALYERSELFSKTVDLDTLTGLTTSTQMKAGRLLRSAYVEESLVFDPFTASLGVRLDSPSDFPQVVSPRVSLLWKPTPWLHLRGGWGRGYRPPTLFELNLPEDNFSAGNPNLKAQTSTTSEAGLEALLGKRALVRFTAFRETARDKITFAPVGPVGPFGPKFIPANLDSFRKVGWEAELEVQPLEGLTLSASHSRINALQTSQELVDALTNQLVAVERPAANVPGSLSSVRLAYRDPGGFQLLLRGTWTGRMVSYYANFDNFPSVTMDTKTLPPSTVVDLYLTQPIRIGAFECDAFFRVDNLFDEKYSLQFGNTIDDGNFPMPPRTFYFGLSPRL
jgi:outer membrane receptor protein involved in Fe transport